MLTHLATARSVQVVYNPADATVFLPRLLPALEKATQTIPDPEARSVVEDAHKALLKLGDEGAAASTAAVADQQVRCSGCFEVHLSTGRAIPATPRG